MMADTKPTFLFVPGAWHGPEIYDASIAILKKSGYECIAIPLPSVGAEPPHTTFEEDVDGIREAVSKLIDQDKKVMLVAHSYTGMPAGEALKGLSGKGGGVRLVYINALAVPADFSPKAGDLPFPDWMRVDEEVRVNSSKSDDIQHTDT